MPRPMKSERNAQIVERANTGEATKVIARDFGITRERVRQIVAQHGGHLRDDRRVRGRHTPTVRPEPRPGERIHQLRERLKWLETLRATVKWEIEMMERQAS